MLKTPISFKGPAGQLQALISEQQGLNIWQQLQQGAIERWRFDEESHLSHAMWNLDGKLWAMSMAWPPQTPLGTCSCNEPKPCQHLLAMAVYNKYKLDQLSPFTRQVKASQDIGQTFVNWLNRQRHDPFPNMARHRVIYVINPDTSPWQLHIYKAYLSQDDSYSVKAPIDSALLNKKQLPKFLSLADQGVMFGMHAVGLNKDHGIDLNPERDQNWFLQAIETGRAFWKACYRPPLRLERSDSVPKGGLMWSDQLVFLPNTNQVVRVKNQTTQQPTSLPSGPLTPILDIGSVQLSVPWEAAQSKTVDWARIQFRIQNSTFSLADVQSGLVQLSAEQLMDVAGHFYLVDKWPSMLASYDAPLVNEFDVNDRSLPNDLVAILPSLLALLQHGWEITISPNHRLLQTGVQSYYLDVAAEGADWFELDVGIEVENELISLKPYLLKAIKSGSFNGLEEELLMAMDDGRLVGLDRSIVMQILNTFGELYEQSSNKETLKLNRNQMMRMVSMQKQWSQNTDQNQLKWLGDEAIKEQVESLSQIHDLPALNPPQNLHADLRPYQLTGVNWLGFLHQYQLHGLLADDMGLGKTLQVLAHCLRLKQQGVLKQPVLIVTPTSLLGNWVAEANRFTPELNIVAGMGKPRQKVYQNLDQLDVLVLSYGVITRDLKHLEAVDWSLLVLDEAQAIKNRSTQISQVIKLLSARQRLCLSGTPIENHLGELWSLFDFLMPGLLGSVKQFKQWFQQPIEKQGNEERLVALKQRLGPLILRRNKHDVAKELPPKTEITQKLALLPEQAVVYESVRLSMAKEIREAIRANQQSPLVIGNALLRLRQVCCHPSMVPLEHLDENMDSVKLHWLRTTLPNILETGGRVLIFSSFTQALALIAQTLDEMGCAHRSLTGKTPPKQRTIDIAAYQAGQFPVYLISLKAGGAGINLTNADTVIHFDPWWNPAAEAQASDRAHRIGQDREVFVYKLITQGTVEEKIHTMQQQKKKLSADVLQQNSEIETILSEQNWEDMLAPIDT